MANPTAVLMSGILMLRHLGETAAADRAEKALFAVFSEHKHITGDLGGKATTKEFVKAVIGSMT